MKNFFILMLLLATKCIIVMTCPEKCSCTMYYWGYSVSCFNQRLGFIPGDIPNNTFSLDLQLNNLIAFDVPLCQPFLKNLNVGNNGISEIPNGFFAECSNLETLSLQHNKFFRINPKAFTNHSSLKSLNLGYNNIMELDLEVCRLFPALQTLDLSENKVSEIWNISGCENLRTLHLNNIGPIKLDIQIFQLFPNLETLFFRQNQISEIGNDVFRGCRTLTTLDLGHNFIREIKTEVLRECNNLKALNLDLNGITTINPDVLKIFPSLQSLSLDGNRIGELDFELCSLLPKLFHLNLGRNQFKSIPEDFFTDCFNLTSLYLGGNMLSELPNKFFRETYSLSFLDLGRNKLTIIDDFMFANISKLQSLGLQDNLITTIHKDAFQTFTLRYLYLSGNPVSNGGYGFLYHCGKLTTLDLDNTRQNESHSFIDADLPLMSDLGRLHINNNMILEIDPELLRKMPNIFWLWLQNNRIQVIKANTFINLDYMDDLDLSYNNISHIEKNAFGLLPRLKKLHLSYNPFECDCRVFPFWTFLNERTSLSTSARCSNGTYVRNIPESSLDHCNPSFPMVVAELMEDKHFSIPGYNATPSLVPIFRCTSGDMAIDSTYLFDIKWFINEALISKKTNVTFENMDSAFLREHEWIHNYKLNMKVKCAVRRWDVLTNPTSSPFIESRTFLAGLEPERYEYTVVEGEPTNITFRSTVPVGCFTSNAALLSHCGQNFYIHQPKYGENPATCINEVSNRDVMFQAEFCGLRLSTANWNEKKELTVYGFNDGIYNYKGRTTCIKLSTKSVSQFNDIWRDVQIPEIRITVKDKDTLLVNRLCQIHNDPHFRSFDGRVFDYMEVGEFVMYRNDKGPYVVHVLFSSCGAGILGPSCNCGVAIRSRNSLFVFRLCKTISKSQIHSLQQPIIRHYSCDENDMFIEQSKNTYKVTLPHGTEIKFTTYRGSRFVSGISIKPSVFDLDNAKGLCGKPNTYKDPDDDFTDRNGIQGNDPKSFGDSWRITPAMTSEQLFVEMPEFLNSSTTNDSLINEGNQTIRHYCACEQQAGSTDSINDFYTVNCNYTETTEFCPGNPDSTEKPPNPLQSSCANVKRQKRSIYLSPERSRRSAINNGDDDDVTDFDSLTYDEDAFTETKHNLTFRNGWNYEKAYNTCFETINEKIPEQLYEDHVNLSADYFINSCIEDIKLVAETSFLSDTVGAMATFIVTEVSRNESLYYDNSTEGSQTVVDYITSQLCPNNCSNKGNCISSVCSCFDGYAGDDCSQQTTKPPSKISLPSRGLCTIGTRSCRKTNIFGDFPSTTVWYFLKHFQIHESEIRYTSKEYKGKAEYRNPYMVSVTLPESRKRRSTSESVLPEGFEISLSNDDTHYGESVKLVIFDDQCFDCNATLITCIDLGVCELASNIQVSSDEINISLIVMVTVIVVAFVILVIGIIVKYKLNYNKRKHDRSHEYEDHGNSTTNKK